MSLCVIVLMCTFFYTTACGLHVSEIQFNVHDDTDGNLQCDHIKEFKLTVNQQFKVYINYTGKIEQISCFNFDDDVEFKLDVQSKAQDFKTLLDRPGYISDDKSVINSNKGKFTYACRFYKKCLLFDDPRTTDKPKSADFCTGDFELCKVTIRAEENHYGLDALNPTTQPTQISTEIQSWITVPPATPLIEENEPGPVNGENSNKNPIHDGLNWTLIGGCALIALIAIVVIILIIICCLKRQQRINTSGSRDAICCPNLPEHKKGSIAAQWVNQNEPTYAVPGDHLYQASKPQEISTQQSNKPQYINNVEIMHANYIPNSQRHKSEGSHAYNSGTSSTNTAVNLNRNRSANQTIYANSISLTITDDKSKDFFEDYIELVAENDNYESIEDLPKYDNVFINGGYGNENVMEYAEPSFCATVLRK